MNAQNDAVEFFYKYAGWSYNPGTETPEQGRRRSARELARAELLAIDNGWEFEWRDDWSVDHVDEFEFYENGGPESCESCTLYSAEGEVLASLGCIDDATDEYRRVVEAELAQEALSDESWSVIA